MIKKGLGNCKGVGVRVYGTMTTPHEHNMEKRAYKTSCVSKMEIEGQRQWHKQFVWVDIKSHESW